MMKVYAKNLSGEVTEVLEGPWSTGADHIRIMPDAHLGADSVIGFTAHWRTNQVRPDWIGPDIGCGVSIVTYSKPLPREGFELFEYRTRETIPTGEDLNRRQVFDTKTFCRDVRRALDRAVGSGIIDTVVPWRNEADITAWLKGLRLDPGVFWKSVGTLGSGNHFIEVDHDPTTGVMGVSVHTGSRALGKAVYRKHGGAGKVLTGKALTDYLTDSIIAGVYAATNRRVIHERISEIWRRISGGGKPAETIESIHNYIDPVDMVIRKGAIKADLGQAVVIPFNMRDGLIIGEGLGNPEWNWSAPHGSGRKMSRNQARKTLDLAEFRESMKNVYSTCIGPETIDESPGAYKDTPGILELLGETVEVKTRMWPVINIKG